MDARVHSGHVTGGLGYVVPPQERPFNYMFEPPAGKPWQNCEYKTHDCRIHVARQVASSLSLDSTGFELLEARSGVADFRDTQQVTGRYYREIEGIALDITGGARAIAFDHLLRQREESRRALGFGRDTGAANPSAVGRVHNDYTEISGPRRMKQVLPDGDAGHPFLILNFWRPVAHAALDTPLALCDARSFPMKDWIASDLIYPDRTGELYLGIYSDAHRWYYYPAMQPHEMLVFKSYDSRLDSHARMTPHCAFDDPTAPPDAPARRSIEARCLVLLD